MAEAPLVVDRETALLAERLEHPRVELGHSCGLRSAAGTARPLRARASRLRDALMTSRRAEPVVRIRCGGPEDEARCRRALEARGLAPEASLTWLVVRDAA